MIWWQVLILVWALQILPVAKFAYWLDAKKNLGVIYASNPRNEPVFFYVLLGMWWPVLPFAGLIVLLFSYVFVALYWICEQVVFPTLDFLATRTFPFIGKIIRWGIK